MGKRGVNLKREESLSSSVNVPSSSSAVQAGVRYGECQKNQAASIGGYAVDGCREFMPSGEEGTDAAHTCAACACHRNFHRRLLDTQVLPR